MQNATEQECHECPQSGVSAGTGGHYAENLPSAEQLAITHDSLDKLLNPSRLPPGQHAVLAYIAAYADEHGLPPALQEIADVHGYSMTNAYQHVEALRRKGLVTSLPRKARTLRVTSAGLELLGIPETRWTTEVE